MIISRLILKNWRNFVAINFEFEPDHIPGLITLSGMEIELSEIIGRKVDLRTSED